MHRHFHLRLVCCSFGKCDFSTAANGDDDDDGEMSTFLFRKTERGNGMERKGRK